MAISPCLCLEHLTIASVLECRIRLGLPGKKHCSPYSCALAAELELGLPAQNPQALDEYADITLKNTLQRREATQVVRISDSENRIYVLALGFPEQTSQRSELDLNLSRCQPFSASLRRSTSRCARLRRTGELVIAGPWIINCNAPSYAEWASAIRTLRRSASSLRRMASAARLIAHCNLDKTSCSYLVSSESLALAKPKLVADCCCIPQNPVL